MGRSCDAETPKQLAEHRGVDPSSLRAPEHDPAIVEALPGFLEDLQGPPRQGNPVLALRLHAVGGNGPDIVLDLVARRAPDLVRACRGQDHELERQPDTGMGLRVADLGQSLRHLAVRERLVMPDGVAVTRQRGGDGVPRRVVQPVALRDGPLHHRADPLVHGPRGRGLARPDDPPFQRRIWRKANPGLDHLPDLEAVIRQEAEAAKVDESALASFRALRLNQGVSDTVASVLLDAGSWTRAEALPAPEDRASSYVLGVDLGQNAAMSAAAAYFRSGELEAFAVFPEIPSLVERGLGDGVGDLYTRMARRGELFQAGRRVSDAGALLREALDRWGRPVAVVCDRWRSAELRQALEAVGFPLADLVERGQGYKDGGEDVRGFRAAVLGDKVRPSRSLLLRSALAEARVTSDPAGNAKLAKNAQGGRRVRARDDAAAAAILAVSAGFRRWHGGTRKRPRWRYAGVA